MIEFDASELTRLAVHLDRAALVTGAGIFAVGKKGAQNIKDGMVADAQGIRHAPRFPASIGYDVAPGGLRSVVFRIGPDKDLPVGALGNILYFGTSNNAPVRDIGKALNDEQPRIEAALLALAAGALR